MPQIHFEIFRLQGKSGDWELVEVADDREATIKQAKQLMAEGHASESRVVKESFQPETGYTSLTIHEEGIVETKKRNKRLVQDRPPPCAKPDDIYDSAARITFV